MKTIWKFTLEPAYSSPYEVEMPAGAEVLSAAMQGQYLRVWALVDTDAKTETRTFWVFGTGMTIDAGAVEQPGMKYVGTAFDGFLVWHVFVEVA